MDQQQASSDIHPKVAELRAVSQRIAALQAEQLRLVAELADWCTSEALTQLATMPGWRGSRSTRRSWTRRSPVS